MAAGLRAPDEGRVLLNGRPDPLAEPRLACAAVLQRPLLRRGTTRANVELGLRLRGRSRKDAQRLAAPWLDRLGIAHLADQPARRLSGGEAQRVSIARALATTPRFLVLDEPFGALDTPTRATLLAELRTILAETDTAALLATHDVREAAVVADRIAILHNGRLRQLGPAAEVLGHPADDFCARVLVGMPSPG